MFSTNSKLAKTTSHLIASFSLPAGITCPGAGACAKFCYAKKGSFRYPAVVKAYQSNLDATSNIPDFLTMASLEIERWLAKASRKKLPLAIRIHASGDFFSPRYLLAWNELATKYSMVTFYAYSKSPFAWRMYDRGQLASNFTLIKSEGSVADERITGRHARIFNSLDELSAAGYDDASNDDSIAFTSKSGLIGLVKH